MDPMTTLRPKILLAVCGSIAAYRSVDFIRKLVKQDYDVEVLLTESAKHFVAEKSIETFLGKKVISNDHFSESHLGTVHIEFARKFDAILVYGATAEFMASYRGGHAHSFLHAQLLAFEGRVILMPAMNPSMWSHPATQENQRVLEDRGVAFLGPEVGAVACGEFGRGKLVDESLALEKIESILVEARQAKVDGEPDFGRSSVLLSLGAMETQLDGVRSLKNQSSGLMGLEVLRVLLSRGAKVVLMQGLVEAKVLDELQKLQKKYAFKVFETSTPDSYSKVFEQWRASVDVFVSAAAVLDFEIQGQESKIDKSKIFLSGQDSAELKLQLKKLPDYSAEFGQTKGKEQVLLSFSLESLSDEKELLLRAMEKAQSKRADIAFVNRLSENSGPGKNTSEAWILVRTHGAHYDVHYLGVLNKVKLAQNLVDQLLLKLKNP